VVLALLPLTLLAGGLSYVGYLDDRERAGQRAVELARSMALTVEGELSAMAGAAGALGLSLPEEPQANNLDDFRRRAEAMIAARYPGARLLLARVDGELLMSTAVPPGGSLPRYVDPEKLRSVLESGQPGVSNLFIGRITGLPVIDVTVPAPRGEGCCLISFTPPVERFADIIRRQRPSERWVLSVFDRQGVNVARTPNPERFVGVPAAPLLRPRLLAQDEGSADTESLEGVPLHTAWSRPGPSGWSVAIGIPRDDLYAPLRRNLGLTAGAAVLALVAALLLARALSVRIARPVHALVDFAAMSETTGAARPSLGLREADSVAAALAAAKVAQAQGEARFRAMQEASPDGFAVLEPVPDPSTGAAIDFRFTYVNPAGLRIMRRTADEAVGRTVGELYPHAHADSALLRHYATVLETGQPRSTEFRIDADGVVGWFRNTAVPLGAGVAVAFEDVSARIATEAALAESEARLRAVLDNVPVAVILAETPSGRIVFGNVGVEKLFRHPLRPSSGPDDYVEWEAYHADGSRVQGLEHPLAQVLATGQPAELEVSYACGDGVRRWIRIIGAPVLDAEARMTGALVVCTDVDVQRRTAELMAHLAEEREGQVARLGARLGAWFEHGTDNLFVVQVAEGGRFVYEGLNPAHERATGLRSEDLRGRTPAEVFPPAVASALEANYRRCLEAATPISYGEEPELPVGRRTWETTLVPVRDPKTGRVEMILGSSRDVTEQRTAQARLAQAQRIEALGQLAGGIAHDFNNVLQAVQGGAGLIEKRPGDLEGVLRIARMMFEAAERGSSITRRLLAFGRRGDLRTEAVDAAALLADMREIFTHTLGTGVGVRIEAPAGLPPLLGDKGQLETVLVNLATNARDAMGGNGVLTLGARLDALRSDGNPTLAGRLKAGSYVRLSVSDTGAGMTPEVLARATEPFFTTKAQGKGTGLGLAMARGFAEQSGGGLGIESEPGRGTTISLWFPIAADGMVPRVEAVAPAMPGRRASILLVDDEPTVRELTAEGLERAGFAVTAAASGPAALARLDAGEEVDVLVTDLSMPGMDGLSMIREAQRRRPGLPAILLTGFATNAAELAVGGALSGTFSLLRKPITTEALAERLSVMLEAVDAGGRPA
jgi:PAS domain S-box-containing protein